MQDVLTQFGIIHFSPSLSQFTPIILQSVLDRHPLILESLFKWLSPHPNPNNSKRVEDEVIIPCTAQMGNMNTRFRIYLPSQGDSHWPWTAE